MLLIDDESYYLAIGRDAPSIIECLSVGEKVAGWIKDCELESINEECISVISYSITNEEMLNCVYGHKPDVPQNKIHQILSDLTHDLGVNTEDDNSQRSNTSEFDNEMYISEEKAIELLHTTRSISNCSMSTTEETPSTWNHQAQDYHTAAEDAINGISSSQTQDIASDSSPLDGGGSFNLLSQGNYVDHDIAFSSDSSCQSSNSNTIAIPNCHDMLDQSTYALSFTPFNNSKAIHDSSLAANHQCATPTTEVYHHSSMANVTFNVDNGNGLQLM